MRWTSGELYFLGGLVVGRPALGKFGLPTAVYQEVDRCNLHCTIYTVQYELYLSSIFMTDTTTDRPRILTLMSLRKRLGEDVSQEEFAAKMSAAFRLIGSDRKVTKQSVSDWERGATKPRFTPEETLAFCQVVGCTLDELAEASIRATANRHAN